MSVPVPDFAQAGQMLVLTTETGARLYCRLTRADLQNRLVERWRFAPPPSPDVTPVPAGAQVGGTMWLADEDGTRRTTILNVADIASGWVSLDRFKVAAGGLSMTSNASSMRAVYGSMEPAPVNDPVDAPPVYEGLLGRFWRCDTDTLRAAVSAKRGVPAVDGTLAQWVVEAPWAHPVWHSYVMTLVHLRPWPGMQGGTRFYVEGGTHEMWLHALSTEAPRQPFIVGADSPMSAAMTPKNFAAQWRQPEDDGTATGQQAGDEAALTKCRLALVEVCSGRLTPDSDGSEQWALLFGDAMMKAGFKL